MVILSKLALGIFDNRKNSLHFAVTLTFFIFLSGCGARTEADQITNRKKTQGPVIQVTNKIVNETRKTYVLFSINVQEFVYVEKSIETLQRLLDIHEKYDVHVDLYLNDAIIQAYKRFAPDLLNRIKNSSVAAVSYHIRPPFPSYGQFDFIGLTTMGEDELRETLTRYEEFATDPVTGLTTSEPGGYQFLKDLIGYAPIVVATQTSDQTIKKALAGILKQKGARFLVEHREQPIHLGEENVGLYLRPEDAEIKIFERKGEKIDTIIAEAEQDKKANQPFFINIKIHDNDLIATASAWTSIYVHTGKSPNPPFDIDRGVTQRSLLSAQETKALWEQYEESVRFVHEHQDQYFTIHALNLLELLDS